MLDLDWFESEARQFNNTGNTLMMLVADFDLKEDADYLVALNTYRDDSDNVQFYIYIYTHIYIVELAKFLDFFELEKFKNSPLG